MVVVVVTAFVRLAVVIGVGTVIDRYVLFGDGGCEGLGGGFGSGGGSGDSGGGVDGGVGLEKNYHNYYCHHNSFQSNKYHCQLYR